MISSSNGFATVTRPYSIGWVDYGMGWPYSDKLGIDLNASFLNSRVNIGLSFYENREKILFFRCLYLKSLDINTGLLMEWKYPIEVSK